MQCARQPPVTSFVGDRRPRAIIFFSVAVTRPPLCSGRDTAPCSHPRPRNRLRGFQGAGRSLPAGETVRSGASETTGQKIKSAINEGYSDRAGWGVRFPMRVACIGILPLSPLPAQRRLTPPRSGAGCKVKIRVRELELLYGGR